MEFGFDQHLDQRQRNLPRLIEANYLLHLTAQELQAVILWKFMFQLAQNVTQFYFRHVACSV